VRDAHLRYRPDIDGLRALAVLAVIGFHVAPAQVPGGFVGVDVFFVISGFVITGLLLAEAQCGRVSVAGFLVRRVRRIFPALVVVLAASLAAGAYLFVRDEFVALSRETAAGAAFVANLLFWRESGYFDAAAEAKPLLHLWSLAVEEQFYIAWPLLVAWAVPRAGALTRLPIALAAVSFALNVALVAAHGAFAFYLLPTRVWELMAGAMLAYRNRPSQGGLPDVAGSAPGVKSGFAWIGAVLIALSFALIDRGQHFPGALALLPVAGTLLIIAAGPRAWLNRVVLSARMLVGIGLVSYPLYLWHWPLLSFVHLIERDRVTTRSLVIAVAAAFGLALATYWLLERPIRRSRRMGTLWLLLGAMTIIAGAGYAGARGLLVPRLASPALDRLVAASHDWSYPGASMRRSTMDTGLVVYSVGSAPRTMVFYGDSNAQQYGPRVEALVAMHPERGIQVVFAASGSCAPLPGLRVRGSDRCNDDARNVDALIDRADVDAVVMIAQWPGYAFNPDFRLPGLHGDEVVTPESPALGTALAALSGRVQRWRSAGKRVYIVGASPSGPGLDPRNLLERTWRGDYRINAAGMPRADWDRRNDWLAARLAAIAHEAGAVFIDPTQRLCTPSRCPAVTPDGEPIYRDAAHLRAAFVREHVDYLDAVVLDTR